MSEARTGEYVPVRFSHLLRDCAVGAIVRGPDSLMVVQDTSTWDPPGADPREREIRYVKRVRSALDIEEILCSPPRAVERRGTMIGWIPALRFPTWMRCPACGLMRQAPWRTQPTEAGHACNECGRRLEQAPWVLVHEDGHLADVPWHFLAHQDSRDPAQTQCSADWTRAYLKLIETKIGRELRCSRCNVRRPFRTSALPSIPLSSSVRQQPWLRQPPREPSDAPALLVEVNDVRVHNPSTVTALVIPPESRIRRGTVTDRLYGSTRDRKRIRDSKTPLERASAIQSLASEYRCRPDEIRDAARAINQGDYPLAGQSLTAHDLFKDEYQALIAEIPNLREDEDFVTEHHTSGWKALRRALGGERSGHAASAVSRLVAVNRLKEIMVFRGFRRAGGERLVPPDIVGNSDWLPALELYGEGIFFTLDEAALQRWEANAALKRRAQAFRQRYVQRAGQHVAAPEAEVTPRFLLCHTLAHLVIHRLDAEAGYPAASLKERIYCATGNQPMAGILIYVAVPDEEGSLGGLMELAQPTRFARLLTAAFEAAQWCSLDPVCAEQEGHGPDLLNRAACHACALVPETSCDYGNVLLDRAFVKGAAPDIPAFPDAAGTPA